MNRPLSLDEVLALPEGDVLCAEIRKPCEFMGGGQFGDCFRDERNGRPVLHDPWYYPAFLDVGDAWNLDTDGNVILRIWSLPQPPTPDELAAWPWEA